MFRQPRLVVTLPRAQDIAAATSSMLVLSASRTSRAITPSSISSPRCSGPAAESRSAYHTPRPMKVTRTPSSARASRTRSAGGSRPRSRSRSSSGVNGSPVRITTAPVTEAYEQGTSGRHPSNRRGHRVVLRARNPPDASVSAAERETTAADELREWRLIVSCVRFAADGGSDAGGAACTEVGTGWRPPRHRRPRRASRRGFSSTLWRRHSSLSRDLPIANVRSSHPVAASAWEAFRAFCRRPIRPHREMFSGSVAAPQRPAGGSRRLPRRGTSALDGV